MIATVGWQAAYVWLAGGLGRDRAAVVGAVPVRRVCLRARAYKGDGRAEATWNHASGFSTTPTPANLQQNKIGAFDIFNLFMKYDVPGESMLLKDLSFTLNVDNVFDKAPPLYRGTYSGGGNTSVGFANGFTLGRLIRVGVSKKF
ncbi:TonB-dependent receptor [Novosphingobium sp. G106]|uniref:TonB-dependent receptor n=1 Tax=Novosphingobium sp. G106 TaxID=2849500 RepID=UPI001C2D4748|nr:TonB-dependent receptor [Novosphingobium sp. G106]MBV1686766.1 TonB-dependent receptor [Novosphingobium sp. G106]